MAFSIHNIQSALTGGIAADSLQKLSALRPPGSAPLHRSASLAAPAEAPPTRADWAAQSKAMVHQANETVAKVDQVDKNLGEIEGLLGQMKQMAQKLDAGQVEGELPELPDDVEAYEQVMTDLAATAGPAAADAGDTPESLQVEKPSVNVLARDYFDMASKIQKLLDETLDPNRDLLRDHIVTGQEPAFQSLDQIRLSNQPTRTLERIEDALTDVSALRSDLDASRRVAEQQALTMTEQVMAESQTPLHVVDGAAGAGDLVARLQEMLQAAPTEAMKAQYDPSPQLAADLLMGIFS